MTLPIGVQVAGRSIAYWPGNALPLTFNWDPTDLTSGHTFTCDVYTGDAARPTATWPASVAVVGQAVTATWSATVTKAWGPGAVWRLLRDGVTVLAGRMWRDHPQVDDDTPLNPSLTVQLVGPPAVTVVVTVGGGSGGSAPTVHIQSTPAQVWAIAHSYTYRPSVDIFDSAGTVVHGDVTHPTTSLVNCTFDAVFGGQASLK